MQIELSTLIMNWINFAVIIAIIVGVIKGIRVIKNFINRTKEMDKKLDCILNELEKKKSS